MHMMVIPCPSVATVALSLLALTPTAARSAELPICGSAKRITCVVDGDTAWFEGVKYRFAESDITGALDCPGLRKSVEFGIGPEPFIVQLSYVAVKSISLVLMPSD